MPIGFFHFPLTSRFFGTVKKCHFCYVCTTLSFEFEVAIYNARSLPTFLFQYRYCTALPLMNFERYERLKFRCFLSVHPRDSRPSISSRNSKTVAPSSKEKHLKENPFNRGTIRCLRSFRKKNMVRDMSFKMTLRGYFRVFFLFKPQFVRKRWSPRQKLRTT